MAGEGASRRRAFITGATGTVGGALARQLVAQGWQVTALHRASSDVSHLQTLGVRLVKGDVVDPIALSAGVEPGTDAFFHVAADMNMWFRHNPQQLAVNVGGTRHAVAAALQAGVKRFIHTSTISAYGRHQGPIREDTPSVAEHSWIGYERSKWLAEVEVRKGMASGLDAVIINPCAILGPGFTAGWSVLFYMLKAGKLKGIPPGTLVANHIKDVVDAHIAAVDRGRAGENYILTGDRLSFADMIHKAAALMGIELKAKVMNEQVLMTAARIGNVISRFTGKEPDLTPEMAALMSQKLACDTDKARRELGYRETPWQVGLEDMYAWLHAQGRI